MWTLPIGSTEQYHLSHKQMLEANQRVCSWISPSGIPALMLCLINGSIFNKMLSKLLSKKKKQKTQTLKHAPPESQHTFSPFLECVKHPQKKIRIIRMQYKLKKQKTTTTSTTSNLLEWLMHFLFRLQWLLISRLMTVEVLPRSWPTDLLLTAFKTTAGMEEAWEIREGRTEGERGTVKKWRRDVDRRVGKVREWKVGRGDYATMNCERVDDRDFSDQLKCSPIDMF